MNTEINQGRGFPLAEEGEAPVVVAPHRQLLAELIGGALRAEHGIRYRKQASQDTSYYAGRRAGFVCSAARLVSALYGGDYDTVKVGLGKTVREIGDNFPMADLVHPDISQHIVRNVAEHLIRDL